LSRIEKLFIHPSHTIYTIYIILYISRKVGNIKTIERIKIKREKLGRRYPKNFLELIVVITVVIALIMPGVALIAIEEKGEDTRDDTAINIAPYARTVKKNETFTISVYVEPGEPIIGVSFDYLYFDHAVIQVNSITEGGLFDPYTTIFNSGTIDNTNGTINNVYGFTDPVKNVTSIGIFCNISFTAQQEIGTSLLDLEDVVITNASGGEPTVTINDGKVAIIWASALYFNEISGKNDYVIFGEAVDANDSGEHDDYDVPKPPESIPPYLRAWFDDGLPIPYDYLLKDCRQYNDTEKIWGLHVEWFNSSPNPVNITVSWDASEFDDSIYNCVVLMRYDPFDEEWDFVANMLTEEEYVYSPRYFSSDWLTDHFQIITAFDTTPPEITGVTVTHSVPKDTSLSGVPSCFSGGWENFTCTVIDNVVVDEAQLNLTYPDAHTEYYIMNKDGDTYYYNTTLTDAGGHYTPGYTYHIWADDLVGNEDTSAPQPEFELPLNADVYEDIHGELDGKVHFMDLVAVSGMYGQKGTG